MPSRPDTRTVTVRYVAPKPKKERQEPVTRIPYVGNLGLTRNLWALVHASCYEDHPEQGHSWTPPEEITDRFAACIEEFDETAPTVPFHPKCKTCRQAAKRVMERRGLDREEIKRCFDKISAKWDWVSRESTDKRRNDDSGVMVVSHDGQLTTDKKIAAKRRAKARKIEQADQKADNKSRATRPA